MTYLTYAEYQEMGGTLDEATFNFLGFDAECFIDWYTFDRLHGETAIPDRVKQCMYHLIKLLEAKNNLISPDTNGAGVNVNAQLEKQANDGVQMSYSVLHADVMYANQKQEIIDTINRYLAGVVNSLGRKLLYRGLYPGE